MTGEPAADTDADVARLRRDLDEARQQISATSEVLTALGRSASDLELVLGTVVGSARRLCKADGRLGDAPGLASGFTVTGEATGGWRRHDVEAWSLAAAAARGRI